MDDGGVSELMQMNANYVEATAAIQDLENTNTNLKHTIQMNQQMISENEKRIKNCRADMKQIIKARAAKRKQIMARGGRVFVRNQEELDFIASEGDSVERNGVKSSCAWSESESDSCSIFFRVDAVVLLLSAVARKFDYEALQAEASSALLSTDDYLEEIDKLDIICSCSMDSIKAGGSILISTEHLGIILQLLERYEFHTTSKNMKVHELTI
ncbi:hypothetical protein SASPL_151256 [Salvia splendens]|uniref:Uncharacterized protein n=1 Tax=Salvia splendens TaxID=180675 RepID=A0A8X8W7M4_SALSN|nr:hypothetical protein SASPL_151256 [Salvia splendens]